MAFTPTGRTSSSPRPRRCLPSGTFGARITLCAWRRSASRFAAGSATARECRGRGPRSATWSPSPTTRCASLDITTRAWPTPLGPAGRDTAPSRGWRSRPGLSGVKLRPDTTLWLVDDPAQPALVGTARGGHTQGISSFALTDGTAMITGGVDGKPRAGTSATLPGRALRAAAPRSDRGGPTVACPATVACSLAAATRARRCCGRTTIRPSPLRQPACTRPEASERRARRGRRARPGRAHAGVPRRAAGQTAGPAMFPGRPSARRRRHHRRGRSRVRPVGHVLATPAMTSRCGTRPTPRRHGPRSPHGDPPIAWRQAPRRWRSTDGRLLAAASTTNVSSSGTSATRTRPATSDRR